MSLSSIRFRIRALRRILSAGCGNPAARDLATTMLRQHLRAFMDHADRALGEKP